MDKNWHSKKVKQFNLKNSWVVRQFKSEYNPIHWHNGHVSGAGFLKVPKNLGKHVQEKTNQTYDGGNLNLVHGSRQFMSNSQFRIVPEVGDFYFFPHYLMHTVYPFTGSANLISDITSTGKTIKSNNLRKLKDGEILKSQACVFSSKNSFSKKGLKNIIKLFSQ